MLGLKFFGMTVNYGFLDRSNILLAVLVAILLHRSFLFFFYRASPNLNIVDLPCLVKLKSLSVSLKQIFIVSHNTVVVEISILPLKLGDFLFANLLDAANSKNSQNFPRALLFLDVKPFQNIVDLTQLVGLDLFLLELSFTVFIFFRLLLFPVIELSFAVAVEILLCFFHRLFYVFYLSHLFVQLAFDLLEDSYAFFTNGTLFLDFLENSFQFVAKVNQVLVNLSDLVEGDNLLSVVSDGHDETKSVALVKQSLYFVPVTVKIEHFRE